MMSLTYQVGHLNLPSFDDPEIEVAEQAMAHAVALSETRRNCTIAVWTGQEHGSELVAIAFQGELFRK
jgi:hypothetical protein